MSTSPSDFNPSVPVPESTGGAVGPSRIRRLFVGPNGIRAGWRLAMFILLFGALNFLVIGSGVRLIPSFAAMLTQARSGGVLSPQFEIIFEGAQLALALLAAGIMSQIEKRPLGAYGMPLAGAFGRVFWQGALWGLAFETAEMLALECTRSFYSGATRNSHSHPEWVFGQRHCCCPVCLVQCIFLIPARAGWGRFQFLFLEFLPALRCAAPEVSGSSSDSMRHLIMRRPLFTQCRIAECSRQGIC